MAELDTRNATIALLLGAIVMAFALVLVTALRVPVAPPIDVLPISIVNMTWAMIALYLVWRDIWWGYLAVVLVGFSVAVFPIVVLSSLFGPRPDILIPHFLGALTDLTIGIGLLICGFRALMPLMTSGRDDFDSFDDGEFDH